jgi:hypothetical protein
MESESTKSEAEQYFLLKRHYAKLTQMKSIAGATMVFVPENNLGLEGSHLNNMIHDIANVRVYWEKDKPGVCKTARKGFDYQFLTTNLLGATGLRFHVDFFTCSRDSNPSIMRSLFMEQLLLYHWEKKAPKDSHSKERKTLTGKQGDKQDDLLIAFMQDLYIGRTVISDPRRLSRA